MSTFILPSLIHHGIQDKIELLICGYCFDLGTFEIVNSCKEYQARGALFDLFITFHLLKCPRPTLYAIHRPTP